MTATTLLPRLDWLSRLRTIMVLRGGQRHVALPSDGVDVRSGRNTLQGGGDWWLAGGATGAVAAYQPIGAASLAASYVNLVNPGTYDAAPGTAPTFDAATGWTFNGIDQYLTTGIVPANTQTWSALMRFSGATATYRTLFGLWARNGGSYFWGVSNPHGSGSTSVRYASGAAMDAAPNLASGVLGFAGNVAYRNGNAETGAITTGTGIIDGDITIGARRNILAEARDEFSDASIQAFAIYNTTLTAPQVAAVSAAVALI